MRHYDENLLRRSLLARIIRYLSPSATLDFRISAQSGYDLPTVQSSEHLRSRQQNRNQWAPKLHLLVVPIDEAQRFTHYGTHPMAKKAKALPLIQTRLEERPELTKKYRDNALPLLGLSLYVQAEDIDSLAAEALTDGGNDKKIDFCFIDRTTNYAAIVQGFCSKQWGKAAAEANKATDLISAAGWLFTGDLDNVPEKLRTVATELRDAIKEQEINRIEFLYIHNCHESENVRNELATAVATAAKLIPDINIAIASHEIGLETLDDLCRAAENEIFVTETIKIPSKNVIDEQGKVWHAIVASMEGPWIHALHQNHGAKLFRANYRDFLGVRNSVKNINKGIKTSVQKDADNFWTYNNGITALVRNIKKVRGKFEIDGISIINGAQTTGSIAECALAEVKDVRVVCRFVTCSDDDVLHNIIKFNNTQNAFRSSDQRSNDIVQNKLKSELEKYGIAYSARRSGITIPSGAITAESIAPLLSAFHGDPQTATRRRNDIFDVDATYSKVFPQAITAEHVYMVSVLGAAVDDVKLDLKVRNSTGKATSTQGKNYEVLKHSTSKLYLLGIIGAVAEEVVGEKLADRFTWRFNAKAMKKSQKKLVVVWKEVVEAILPLVAGIIGDDSYAATRDFGKSPEVAKQVAALISAGGSAISNRFALLNDETEW